MGQPRDLVFLSPRQVRGRRLLNSVTAGGDLQLVGRNRAVFAVDHHQQVLAAPAVKVTVSSAVEPFADARRHTLLASQVAEAASSTARSRSACSPLSLTV